MHAFTTLLAFTGLVSFAAALPQRSPPVGANGCPMGQKWVEQSQDCTTQGRCPGYPQKWHGVNINGTYLDVERDVCVECPYGAWECTAQGATKCWVEGTVLINGQCAPNAECLALGNKKVSKSWNTNPERYHRTCVDCSAGTSAYRSDYTCDRCPAALGIVGQCTADKALSCRSGYVLYEDKCLSKTCPIGWYNDNGVCKTCESQDPKSVTCELGKSLTCKTNQLLVLSNNRCTGSACPYTPANGLPGSYRDGSVCKSCPPEAFNCNAAGSLSCYNYEGTQYYLYQGQCLTKEACLAVKPKSTLWTQLQTKTGVTYGTC
ncbi:hypothetical protein JCM6882_001806 [Rhodosporidiobolus microsporus]